MRAALMITAMLSLQSLSACVSSGEYNRKVAEADSLRRLLDSAATELDELMNGAARRLALAEAAVAQGRDSDALAEAQIVVQRHPDAPEATRARELLAGAQKRVDALTAARAKRRSDSIAAEEARFSRALSAMRKTHDDIREIDFYTDRSTPDGHFRGKRVYAYLTVPKGSRPSLRLVIRYQSDEWLFVRSYTFKVDGRIFEIVPERSEIQRDNAAYLGVWEWLDTYAGVREEQLLEALAVAKSATLRYNGDQYYSDRAISQGELAAIRRVLDARQVLSAR